MPATKIEALLESVVQGQAALREMLARIEIRLDHLEEDQQGIRSDHSDQNDRAHRFWREDWPRVAVAVESIAILPERLRAIDDRIDTVDKRIDAMSHVPPVVDDHAIRIKRLEDQKLTASTGAAIAGTGAIGGTLIQWLFEQFHNWWSGTGGH